jgi:AhpD family alkylhydroperoxidase
MSDAEGLSPRDKELIAIGASVGAGCQPCTAHHLQAAEAIGATRDEIRQAVADALCVRRSATQVMNDWVDKTLGDAPAPESPCCGEKPLLRELISLAAGVAVSCSTNVARHLAAARRTGASARQIQIAVGVARAIRGVAERHAVQSIGAEEAEGGACCASDTPAQPTTKEVAPSGGCGDGCGCGAAPATPSGVTLAALHSTHQPATGPAARDCACGG